MSSPPDDIRYCGWERVLLPSGKPGAWHVRVRSHDFTRCRVLLRRSHLGGASQVVLPRGIEPAGCFMQWPPWAPTLDEP